jgi:hypothetical protein
MKIYGEVDIYLHEFSNLALAEGEWSSSCSGAFTLEAELRYPLSRRLEESPVRFGRCEEENIFPRPGIEFLFPGCPAHSLVSKPAEIWGYIIYNNYNYIRPCSNADSDLLRHCSFPQVQLYSTNFYEIS